jgi:hypothetical protein
MPKRPPLSTESFLASVFRPSKNPRPVGLRKHTVANTTKRRTSRVRSYNRFDAVKQEILDRTGNREKYLRGEVSLADARQQLREDAVRRGIARPYVPRSKLRMDAMRNIERLARQRPVRAGQGSVNVTRIATNVVKMSHRQLVASADFQTYSELVDHLDDYEYQDDDDPSMSLLFYK